MTWLVPKLNKRVQVLKSTHVPNSKGGFDFGFDDPSGEPLLTIWMGIKPVGYSGTGQKYIRGQQVDEAVSHEFTARRIAVASLGREMGLGFSTDFDVIADLALLKSDYFLFLQQGSTSKGRLFRIRGVIDRDENGEYYTIIAEEIEERGTGYQA